MAHFDMAESDLPLECSGGEKSEIAYIDGNGWVPELARLAMQEPEAHLHHESPSISHPLAAVDPDHFLGLMRDLEGN
ncbi:hypothetical protein BOW53_11395 [Solemya pervernicosa gill symbiont]|uniref:Uncharacterized protein n=2 Tax=Gammaproteobacteria incertae sedis TaxID=118884 RepID=A0A1T2L325_9GAMM|nr:hypothetical protein [Candidatus Reidiella endopervernicosa]OOZ39507.1 hypothetical protein BOW53_11395 [Solemya pervernicosa gill symbiont]QKQ25867.1 hypothetical protein HUE57_05910 [Candidatus Reidiella endopervernicosa]